MKYAIYDNVSDVITPSGKIYTAERWLEKFPWAKSSKMVVSGGPINGSFAFIYEEMIERARLAGVNFTNCRTDNDYLRAIEDFEKNAIKKEYETAEALKNKISDQERIANALEDLIALQMPDSI